MIRPGWVRRTIAPAVIAILAMATAGMSPAASSADVLYDQTTGTAGGYLSAAPGSGTLADDLTIPPGPPWWVRGVHVDGLGGVGSKFQWSIVSGDALPGDLTSPGARYINSSNSVNEPLAGTGSFDIPVDPRHPLVGAALTPGHYWLTVVAKDFASPSKPPSEPWSWQTQSPLSGFEAATLSKKTCGSYDWKPLSECGKTGPDLRFRIEGDRVDRDFLKVKLGKPKRMPAGGIETILSVPAAGVVKARKVSGRGKLRVHLGGFFETDEGHYVGLLKVQPLGATKKAVKNGLVLHPKVAISYSLPGIDAHTTTILKAEVKKVRPGAS